jgi:AAA domain
MTMTLRITKSTDTIEVKNLTACFYATPGVGKTTLGFTAEKPLLLDFDKGSYRAGNRGDVVQVESWSDVTSITAEDLKSYATLIVDTAGRALDTLTVSIIAENPKMGRGGALTLQGFGELKSKFISWTKLIRSFGMDVVLLSHSDEQRSGDEIIERLDIQGGSKNEVYKAADAMGRVYINSGKRFLNFSPTDTAFGKNPAQLPPLEVPAFSEDPQFLGNVLQRIKSELNRQSETQKVASAALIDWKSKIDALATVEQFNGMLTGPEKPDDSVRDNVKRLLSKAAKAKGFAFDKKAGAFVAAAA